MTDHIRKIQDLRPGDIMFGPIGGFVGAGVAAGQLLVDGGFRVGKLSVRHVGIVTEAHPGTRYDDPAYPYGITDTFKLVQAMPGGAEEITMTYDKHWTPRHAYVRLPEDYPGQAGDAATIAKIMANWKVGYSFASYAALVAWRWGLSTPKLEAWINRRQSAIRYFTTQGNLADIRLPVEAICSVLVDQAWSMTGKKIFEDGRPHQCVTPSQLGARLLTGMEGVTWGFPIDYLDPDALGML